MKIASVKLYRATLPLVSRIHVGGVTLDTRETVLITLGSDDDFTGPGEAAPLTGFSHESVDDVLLELRAAGDALLDHEIPADIAGLNGAFDRLLADLPLSPSARCGLETALLSLLARREGRTPAEILSPTASGEIGVNALITDIGAASDEALRLVGGGFTTLKLKVGRTALDREADAIRALRSVVGDGIALRLDANRAWSLEQAMRFAERIRDLGIEYIEEPCRSIEETARLMKACALPVAYDESLAGLSLAAVRDLPTPAAFVLKPTLLGGFEHCAGLARIAKERGARAVTSSLYESEVGIGALCQFAAAYGSDDTAHGLDTVSCFAGHVTKEFLAPIAGRVDVGRVWRITREFNMKAELLSLDYECCAPPPPIRMSLETMPERRFRRKNAAIIDDRVVLDYVQFNDAIVGQTELLEERGIEAGVRVAIVEPNRPETVVLLWALWHIGAVATLVDPRLPSKIIEACLARTATKVRVSFTPSPSPPGLSIKTVLLPPAPDQRRSLSPRRLNHARDATIMFTSGSSGAPKAVMHTVGNHFESAVGSGTNIVLHESDRWLLSLPLFHVGGLAILWRCALASAAIVMAQPGDDLTSVALTHGVTHISVVPTQLERILRSKATLPLLRRQLKVVLLGGAPAASRLIERARAAGLPVYTSYGSTEMASQIATGSAKEPTLPKVLPGRELRLGFDNEILVKGATLFRGYVTELGVEPEVDAMGWFHTGDLGCLRRDGTLTVLGRKDNMFVSGGENIHPEQIERALGSIDGVRQAIVVPVDDPEFGCRPVAFIRCDFDWTLDDAEESLVGETSLRRELEKSLPHFMIPVAFYPWPESYRSAGLKEDRTFFRELVRSLRRG